MNFSIFLYKNIFCEFKNGQNKCRKNRKFLKLSKDFDNFQKKKPYMEIKKVDMMSFLKMMKKEFQMKKMIKRRDQMKHLIRNKNQSK